MHLAFGGCWFFWSQISVSANVIFDRCESAMLLEDSSQVLCCYFVGP